MFLFREILSTRIKHHLTRFLQDLRNRGVAEIDLIITDGHDGLLAAVGSLFRATPRQRCLVHKQRNALNAIPHRERQEVTAELTGIWKQEKKEDAFLNLAAFKAKYQKRYPEAMRSGAPWRMTYSWRNARLILSPPQIEMCLP